MGAVKRPKLRFAETDKGVEYFYYRRPSTRTRKKRAAEENAPENVIPHPKSKDDGETETPQRKERKAD